MIKQQLYLFCIFLFPAQVFANCYIDIGKGGSDSSITIREIENGSSLYDEHDKSGSVRSLSFACTVSNRFSVSIDYAKLLENFDFLGVEKEIETYSYGLSTSFNLYTSDSINFAVGVGYGKWNSKTVFPNAYWVFSNNPGDPALLVIEEKSYSSDGYTPYVNVDLNYLLNQNLSLGFKYNYFDEIGYIETNIDFDKLSVGAIDEVISKGEQKYSSDNTISLYLRWSF